MTADPKEALERALIAQAFPTAALESAVSFLLQDHARLEQARLDAEGKHSDERHKREAAEAKLAALQPPSPEDLAGRREEIVALLATHLGGYTFTADAEASTLADAILALNTNPKASEGEGR